MSDRAEMIDPEDEPRCKSCGIHWGDHLGIAGTCAELERLRRAMWHLSHDIGANFTARHEAAKALHGWKPKDAT
jgi:hypothetical protein